MSKRISYILLLFMFMVGLIGCATAKPEKKESAEAMAPPVAIMGVAISDNMVEINISGEYSPSFSLYKPSDPFTVVIDMPGVGVGDVQEKTVSDKEGISEVRVIKSDPYPSAKVEVLLANPSTLEPEYAQGVLVLKVAGAEKAPEDISAKAPEEVVSSEVKEAAVEPEELPEVLPPAEAITGIGFDRTNGRMRMIISGDGILSPDVYTLKGKVVIDIPNVAMKTSLPDKVAAPVKAIRQGTLDGKVRLIVDVKDRTDFVATTEGNNIIVSFPVDVTEEVSKTAEEAAMPVQKEAAPAAYSGPAGKFTGKLISLDFQDADIKPIIRLLAGDVAGYNVVLHPGVSGTINLRLKDVPWDKALDIILKQNNLESQAEENIIWVAPAEVFKAQKEKEAERKVVYEKVADIIQAIIHLDYIAAADMKAQIENDKLLSPRGRITVDSRANSLIVNDTEDNIRKIRLEEIPYWDTPEHGTMQVMIEAKLVEVNTDYSRQLGIRWGGTNVHTSGSDSLTTDFGVDSPVGAALDQVANPILHIGAIEVGSSDTLTLDLNLEALEAVGKTRKLANPKVLTTDKQSATIKQGVQIPYSTIEDGTAKVAFQEAVLSLTVTPEIQPNGIVKLNISATNDTPVAVGGQTAINKQEVKTNALVKNGETLVLGGIYTNTESELEQRIPWLGKIPIIGWLFKTRTESKKPTELLIFITPNIIK